MIIPSITLRNNFLDNPDPKKFFAYIQALLAEDDPTEMGC